MDRLESDFILKRDAVLKQIQAEEQTYNAAKQLEGKLYSLRERSSSDLYSLYNSALGMAWTLSKYCSSMYQVMNDLLVESAAVSSKIGEMVEKQYYEIQNQNSISASNEAFAFIKKQD